MKTKIGLEFVIGGIEDKVDSEIGYQLQPS